jgi:hypothetical protein
MYKFFDKMLMLGEHFETDQTSYICHHHCKLCFQLAQIERRMFVLAYVFENKPG